MRITTPTKAVLAIYAKENGKGMIFDHEDGENEPPPEQPKSPQKPQLRVVK
jgi:stringent starvation protein B